MSDSYVVQLTCGPAFSPVAYASNYGRSLPELLREFDREWRNANMHLAPCVDESFTVLVEALAPCCVRNASRVQGSGDGDGSAGVVVVELSEDGLRFTLHDGYLALGSDGFPEQHADCCAGHCTVNYPKCPIWG